MHPIRHGLCAAIVFAAASLASPAQAQSVTFNLTGEVLPGVCQFTVNDVDLGSYVATQFTGAFNGAWVNVPVQVTRCDPLITKIAMRITGVADASKATYFRGLTGVGVELQQGIAPNTPIVPAGTTLSYTTAAGTYMLRARMAQTAASVAAGRFSAPVTITLSYN